MKTEKPRLMLAQEYQCQPVLGWAMAEKLDGVRALWDGERLISRGGMEFAMPRDFAAGFPPFALDGELYGGRGEFERTSAAVRSKGGDWIGIKFHVFDAPNEPGGLYERLGAIRRWLAGNPGSNIEIIEQFPVTSLGAARRFLREIEAGGGEGVVFHNPALPYRAGRNSGLLKWKSRHDEEATVVETHSTSVTCENRRGRFRISAGLADLPRLLPVGAVITYCHQGFTSKGLPRFPVYLRMAQASGE